MTIICHSFAFVALHYHSVFPFCIDIHNTRDVIDFWKTRDLGGGCRKGRISESIRETIMPKKDQGEGQGIE